MIYFNFPKQIYKLYKDEIDQRISKVLESGSYINSNELKKFESNFSKYIKVKNAIGVGNATDAIYISLLALNIKKGDEVLTVSHTATATVMAIINTGATPVFLDVSLSDYNMNIDKIEKKITKKTKAIVIVHLYGQSCDMEKLTLIAKKNAIPIIEDCAQSAGSKYKSKMLGSFGQLSCFSFFPTKNLSAIGDGGMICCNDNSLASKIRCLREYGWNKQRNACYIGINSRLDEIQAAILNVKIKYLNKDNIARRTIAKKYNKKIVNPLIIKPRENVNSYHVYHLYVIRIKKRDKFIKYLKENKIIAGIHYKLPVHKQSIYYNSKIKDLINTEKICKELISLPIYPGLNSAQQNKIIKLTNIFS